MTNMQTKAHIAVKTCSSKAGLRVFRITYVSRNIKKGGESVMIWYPIWDEFTRIVLKLIGL